MSILKSCIQSCAATLGGEREEEEEEEEEEAVFIRGVKEGEEAVFTR